MPKNNRSKITQTPSSYDVKQGLSLFIDKDIGVANKKSKIKNLPEDQRPREKMLKYSPEELSDAELLAIILRTGTKGKSAIELAEELLESVGGSFKGFSGRDIKDITKIKGIKNAKLVAIAATMEIAHRILKQAFREKGIF
ncbi:MAG: hypothetical protein CVT89_01990 [Candidatus Altiarchaeales archaeon HGW-Altiarchaeales-2]|nr:MAG: hypothetical protein CVT89_01990 [Candidatus Altiarchaeales archaeon HGW-Altiarchaeales-2]